MILYMTRISMLDTAADLYDDLLLQQIEEGYMFFLEMIGMSPEEPNEANVALSRVWEGYEIALGAHIAALCAEAHTRGLPRNEHLDIKNMISQMRREEDTPFEVPLWFQDLDVLRSHRSNLVRRWPQRYGDMWKGTPFNWPYLWPFSEDDGDYELMLSKHDKALLKAGKRSLPKSVKDKVANR